MNKKVLINLPGSFFKTPELNSIFRRLSGTATIRKRSHNTPEEIQKDLAWADAVLMWAWPELGPDLLAQCPRLKFAGHLNVTRPSAEFELQHGLALSESRHGFSPAVAEMALTLILDGLRRTTDYHAAFRTGKEVWESRVSDQALITSVRDRQLTGRSVGIVGFGGIGQRLAELLGPFNTDLRTYDPFLPESVAKKHGAKLVGLMELVRKSDVIFLCAACNSGTSHLVSAKHVAAMKKGTLLVNVGRSALVDMDALMTRLKNEELVAMLDVFDKEPLQKGSPLRKMKNAYLTPHVAGSTRESLQTVLNMLIDDLEAHWAGKKRKHAVTQKQFHCLSN